MRASGFSFDKIAAVAGSGQQHGSAYFKTGSKAKLASLSPSSDLKTQLGGAFSVPNSPIWMDSSTGAQCAALEKAVGGPKALAGLTGSRAYERFTGNQIAKIAAQHAAAYGETERICLVSRTARPGVLEWWSARPRPSLPDVARGVCPPAPPRPSPTDTAPLPSPQISSLMCSVLAGAYAPIDFSDGCGMNLLDMRTRQWSPQVMAALASTAPGLADKLGPSAASHSFVGTISPYFSTKYGLNPSASVIAWSGDNPNSVAGLGLREPGDVAISLGTSDTMFGITATPTPGVEGHIFVNPVAPSSYMAMLCYKNGSLTRERVRNEAAGGSWDAFNAMLAAQPAGNGGHVGFFIDQPEITPGIPKAGVRRFGPDGKRLPSSFPSPAHEVRAVVEGQFMSLRAHGESVGLTSPRKVIATGGASGNPAITQVLSDVFGVPVYVAAQTDSASLGAAYRALHGQVVHEGRKFVTFEHILSVGKGNELKLAASPSAAAHAAITKALPAYRAAERQVLAESA